MFKEELTPIIHNLFWKTEEEVPLSISLYDASITLMPKPDTNSTKSQKQ